MNWAQPLLKDMNKIHFIGIGGIGVSALAKYYLEKEYEVSGSDLVSSEITQALEELGANISIGEHKENNVLEDTDLIIYSPAVKPNNPEIKNASKLGIKMQSYPEALGDLTKEYFTIAVSGTHGKSSTSAMMAILMIKAGLDPTVIIGTKLKEFNDSNCRVGKSKYLIIEADEWSASFLNYSPNIIVLTNIEREHLDFYKDLEDILNTYQKYIGNLDKDGFLIVNKDDKNINKLLDFSSVKSSKIKKYSLKQKESEEIKKIIKVPGDFNISNALAALTVARTINVSDKESFSGLASYEGAWRRFETNSCKIPDSDKIITLINDYAHHPTEIKVALKAAREKFPNKKIWIVFQPHQYQRTFYLFDYFIDVLSQAQVDKLIIADIYDVAGREQGDIRESVSSAKLVTEVKKKFENEIMYIPGIKEISDYLKKNMNYGDVLMIVGAGDIYKLADYFPLDRT